MLPTIEAALRCTVYFDRVAGEGHAEPGRTLFDTGTWKTCQVALLEVEGGGVALQSCASAEWLKHEWPPTAQCSW